MLFPERASGCAQLRLPRFLPFQTEPAKCEPTACARRGQLAAAVRWSVRPATLRSPALGDQHSLRRAGAVRVTCRDPGPAGIPHSVSAWRARFYPATRRAKPTAYRYQTGGSGQISTSSGQSDRTSGELSGEQSTTFQNSTAVLRGAAAGRAACRVGVQRAVNKSETSPVG